MDPKILFLKELISRRESEKTSRQVVSSGCLPLDRLLPQRGFQQGSLVEWIAGGAGSGAGLLAMLAARSACRDGGALVLIDRERSFYPPAASACQLDLQNMVVVHPDNEKDECWALEQALRCPDTAAVVAWPQRLTAHAFRRLQLAAECGGSLGLLIRPATARNESSWAGVRMFVSPCGDRPGECTDSPSFSLSNPVVAADDELETHRQSTEQAFTSQHTPSVNTALFSRSVSQRWRLRVELLRCGGCLRTTRLELEIDDQTGEVHDAHPRPVAIQLAGTASGSRQARA